MPAGRKADWVNDAIEMKLNGATLKEIAKSLGLSVERVREKVRKPFGFDSVHCLDRIMGVDVRPDRIQQFYGLLQGDRS